MAMRRRAAPFSEPAAPSSCQSSPRRPSSQSRRARPRARAPLRQAPQEVQGAAQKSKETPGSSVSQGPPTGSRSRRSSRAQSRFLAGSSAARVHTTTGRPRSSRSPACGRSDADHHLGPAKVRGPGGSDPRAEGVLLRAQASPRPRNRLGIASNPDRCSHARHPGHRRPGRLFENSIRFHAQETLPIPVTEAILDHVILEGEGQGLELHPPAYCSFCSRTAKPWTGIVEACRRAREPRSSSRNRFRGLCPVARARDSGA